MKKWRSRLIVGFVLQLPFIAVISFIIFIIRLFDSFYGQLITLFTGREIPGLGLLTGLLIAVVLGLVMETERGKRAMDFLLKKLPQAKWIMDRLREFVDQWKRFYELAEKQGVFLASYHRKEMLYPAVATNSISADNGKIFITVVFGDIPVPKPFMVLKSEIIYTRLSFTEATTYMLTGGLTIHLLRKKLKAVTLEEYIKSHPLVNIDI